MVDGGSISSLWVCSEVPLSIVLFAAGWLKTAALFLPSARTMSRQQSPEADNGNCALCMCPLGDGLPERLPCSHVLHAHCLDEFAKSMNLHRARLRCPVCRPTPEDMDTAASKLMTESTLPVRTEFQVNLAPPPAQPLLL